MSKVYIGLGSNKGDRIEFLHNAIIEIENEDRFSILDISSFYETKPYGVADQPNYINGVVLIETDFTPLEVYNKVKDIIYDQFEGVQLYERKISGNCLELELYHQKIKIVFVDYLQTAAPFRYAGFCLVKYSQVSCFRKE